LEPLHATTNRLSGFLIDPGISPNREAKAADYNSLAEQILYRHHKVAKSKDLPLRPQN
jgi:hypothetical protein